MTLSSGSTRLSKAQKSKGPVGNKAEREHDDFLEKGKRKKVLVKEPFHDTRISAANHLSKAGYYELEILKTVQKLAELKRDINSSKRDLCLRQDFQVMNLFLHFDKGEKRKIGLMEAEVSLAQLGLFPHKSDICLLLKSFDRKFKGILDFDDFYNMLVPNDEEMQEIIESRHETPLNEREYIKSISKDTFQALQKTLQNLIEYAVSTECLKQRLVFEVGVNLTQAFSLFPKSNNRILSIRDVGYSKP